jgi:hypothetical protein
LGLTPKVGTSLLTLSLTGPAGLDYTIQSSTNLVSWQDLTNMTSVQLTTVIFDGQHVAFDHEFYRAVSR